MYSVRSNRRVSRRICSSQYRSLSDSVLRFVPEEYETMTVDEVMDDPRGLERLSNIYLDLLGSYFSSDFDEIFDYDVCDPLEILDANLVAGRTVMEALDWALFDLEHTALDGGDVRSSARRARRPVRCSSCGRIVR